MKYIIHIVLVFLLLNVSVQALSLKEAVNDSLSNNLSLKIEAINVDMAEEDYLQSTTDYFPTITLSGSMSENDYSDIKSQSGSATNGYELSPSSKSIVLSQNVFSGFSRFYSSLSIKEQLHIQNLTQSKVTQDIILETIDAYYNVLLAQKIVQSNKDNFNSVSERFNATSKEFEVGLASKTDVAQSDAFLNNSKINLLDAKINLKNTMNSFYNLIGTKPNNLTFSEINSEVPDTYEKYRELVISNNYTIRIVNSTLDVYNANIGVARSALYPQINLTASKTELDEYSTTIDELTNEELQATVTWPIFTSGKSLSNIRKAKKQKNSQIILIQKTTNETLSLAENIWENYLITDETVEAAKLNFLANKTAYEGTVIEEEVGERSVLDVLTARQSLLNSEIKYFQEQKDREITKAQVMYMSGILNLSSLGIN